ncbi:MAG TPA: heme exporter protein CcmD [Telluria sp.]|jgi:heme exporter protein D
MSWDSWHAFFDMGGYGLYVWGSALLTFALMFGEIFSLSRRWNGAIKHLGNALHSEEEDDVENKG